MHSAAASEEINRTFRAPSSSLLREGDTVEATHNIVRVDRRFKLAPGEKATVTRVCNCEASLSQIVDITFGNNGFMRDIVVRNGVPLRKCP